MAKNKIFTQVPLQDIERTKFDLSFRNSVTMYHGYLTPVGVVEALPHDTITADVKAFVRMSTPIAPIMGDIDMYVVAVNVPMRITWEDWTKFYGAQDDVIDISNIDNDLRIPKGIMPSFSFLDSTNFDDALLNESEFSDLTYPEIVSRISIASYMIKISQDITYLLNDLPLRAYFLTWNWLFRNEYLQEPILVDTSDGRTHLSDFFDTYSFSGAENHPEIGLHKINGKDASYFSPLLKVNKHGDRFTTSLPWPQKGDPVVLGLSDFAPVVSRAPHFAEHTNGLFWKKVGEAGVFVPTYNEALGTYAGQGVTSSFTTEDSLTPSRTGLAPANLYADLTSASAISINQLRIASAIQRMLEKDAIYGTRYDEKLMAHFGVAPMSEVLNQPQYLGGMKMAINIDTVLQTTGHTTGETSSLGAPGAVSMSYNKGSLFTQSFSEPSYILLLAYTRQVRSYSFIDRLFLRDKKLDFYWPEFAHVGYSPVYTIEVGEVTDNFTETSFINGVGANQVNYFIQNPNLEEQDIFGYQEYANEYRYIPNKTSGLLNPSYPGALDYWTLTDGVQDFYLSANFIEEDRINIARALTTGTMGPDYIAQFGFEIYASRPMPAFGLPGETRKF